MGRKNKITKEGLNILFEHMKINNPMFKKEIKEKSSKSHMGQSVQTGLYRQKHDDIICSKAKELQEQGYATIILGTWKCKIPDLIAIKNGEIIAYEVSSSGIDNEKYRGNPNYDKVEWITFKTEKQVLKYRCFYCGKPIDNYESSICNTCFDKIENLVIKRDPYHKLILDQVKIWKKDMLIKKEENNKK